MCEKCGFYGLFVANYMVLTINIGVRISNERCGLIIDTYLCFIMSHLNVLLWISNDEMKIFNTLKSLFLWDFRKYYGSMFLVHQIMAVSHMVLFIVNEVLCRNDRVEKITVLRWIFSSIGIILNITVSILVFNKGYKDTRRSIRTIISAEKERNKDYRLLGLLEKHKPPTMAQLKFLLSCCNAMYHDNKTNIEQYRSKTFDVMIQEGKSLQKCEICETICGKNERVLRMRCCDERLHYMCVVRYKDTRYSRAGCFFCLRSKRLL